MPTKPKPAFPLPTLARGEHYAGIIAVKGKPTHHLILLAGETAGNHQACVAWATKKKGELPTRREQPLLFANLPEQFKPASYWSSIQHASDADFAWGQFFDGGGQDYWRQGLRVASPCRPQSTHLVPQSFTHSTEISCPTLPCRSAKPN